MSTPVRATERGRRVSDIAGGVFLGTVLVGAFFPEVLLKTVATIFLIWSALGVLVIVVGLLATRTPRRERGDRS